MHLDRTPAAAVLLNKLGRTACTFAAVSIASFSLAACGNSYRPVVSAINPVGPAGQPTKYAVAISSTGATTPGLVTLIDVSGDTVLDTTLIGVNPYYFQLASSGFEGYTLNSDGTLTSFAVSSSLIASQVLQSTLYANSYPQSLYSQGTYLYVAEGAAPAGATAGPSRNAVAELSGLPPGIQEELPTGANTIYTVGASGSPRAYALSLGTTATGNGTAIPIETTSNTTDAPIPVGIAPTYGVMTSDSRRAFILNKGSNNVTVINAPANALDTFYTGGCNPATSVCTVANTIADPAAVAPVWADFAPPLNEVLITNSGTTTITGFSISGNVVTFQTAGQTLTAGSLISLSGFPTSTFLNGQTLTVSATGLSGTTFQAALTHANAGATVEFGSGVGKATGSVSIVSIPLCNSATVTTNPTCDASNPLDAVGFGQIVANVKVGVNPVMIAVLQDGSQAFVANAGNAAQGIAGSVSVINLSTNTVVATIPFIASTNENDGSGHGHPNFIAVTTGTPYGKAYVTAGDSTDITIIRSDLDTVLTHLSLQGLGVSVRTNTP